MPRRRVSSATRAPRTCAWRAPRTVRSSASTATAILWRRSTTRRTSRRSAAPSHAAGARPTAPCRARVGDDGAQSDDVGNSDDDLGSLDMDGEGGEAWPPRTRRRARHLEPGARPNARGGGRGRLAGVCGPTGARDAAPRTFTECSFALSSSSGPRSERVGAHRRRRLAERPIPGARSRCSRSSSSGGAAAAAATAGSRRPPLLRAGCSRRRGAGGGVGATAGDYAVGNLATIIDQLMANDNSAPGALPASRASVARCRVRLSATTTARATRARARRARAPTTPSRTSARSRATAGSRATAPRGCRAATSSRRTGCCGLSEQHVPSVATSCRPSRNRRRPPPRRPTRPTSPRRDTRRHRAALRAGRWGARTRPTPPRIPRDFPREARDISA